MYNSIVCDKTEDGAYKIKDQLFFWLLFRGKYNLIGRQVKEIGKVGKKIHMYKKGKKALFFQLQNIFYTIINYWSQITLY